MLMVLYFSILTRDKGEQVFMGMGFGSVRIALNGCSLLSVPGIESSRYILPGVGSEQYNRCVSEKEEES